MKLKYENSLEDVVAFSRYHNAHSPAVMKAKFTCMILVSVLVIFGSLFIPTTDYISRPIIIAGAIVFSGIFSVMFHYQFAGTTDRQVRRLYKEGNNKSIFGQHEIQIDNNGLSKRTAFNESRQSWQGVERIVETDRYVFIYVASLMAHVIPKQSVIEGDLDAFLVLAKQLWHENNPDAAGKQRR
ncbi:YcxB family protein [Lignipirellula cremea]|uniref:YcxB-like C-terminal domain-containing protein n=1 Tax=Lignipirellula cremea TaxID=2528010 RepID=A0A518DRA7_9BACT|nr:YcxB family protein [Lignipirellula cremea]QDU94371.1 hypothetical protein Pla8534_21600 [Lignipirellula cremea]